MPRAIAKIRKRYEDGISEVLDWELEELLVFGHNRILGPGFENGFVTAKQWRIEWDRWRDVLLPKVLESRPGTRPFAMYVVGEIPRRELSMRLPDGHGYEFIDIRQDDGSTVRYWLNVPRLWMEPEPTYLHRLGIVDAAELKRHKAWMRERNPDCPCCPVDHYRLEMSLYE